ncbi:MAG: hypothetical protein GY738_04860 [Pseudoalteromonas sp.]|nr:hypothetical protein [Pseudoalteromonas sp.]
MVESFTIKGHPARKIIKYAGIASSTWYQLDKKVAEDGRNMHEGRVVRFASVFLCNYALNQEIFFFLHFPMKFEC